MNFQNITSGDWTFKRIKHFKIQAVTIFLTNE